MDTLARFIRIMATTLLPLVAIVLQDQYQCGLFGLLLDDIPADKLSILNKT
jgi:hypothetical protein